MLKVGRLPSIEQPFHVIRFELMECYLSFIEVVPVETENTHDSL